MRIPKNNKESRVKTTSVITGSVAAVCQTNPISAAMWALWQEQQTAAWRYRVQEFMEYIEKNGLTKKLLKDEYFQDGLALIFEKHIKQRREKKRQWILSLLKDFAETETPQEYEIERFLHIIDIITQEQYEDLVILSQQPDQRHQFEKDGDFDHGLLSIGDIPALESLGLFESDRWSELSDPDEKGSIRIISNQTVVLTCLGEDFLDFIKEEGVEKIN